MMRNNTSKKKQNNKDGKRLYCSARKAGSHQVCSEKTVRYDKVIDALTVYVSNFVSSFVSQEKMLKESNSDMVTNEIAPLENEKKQLATKKFQLYDKYRSGKISREVFKQENMVVTARKDEIDGLLNEYHNRKGNDLDNICDRYDNLYDGFSDIEKFDVDKYRKFIKHVIIYDEESVEVVWNINDPMMCFQ